MATQQHSLSSSQQDTLLQVLHERFARHANRHPQISWSCIETKLKANTHKLWSLYNMDETGGEPDVVAYDKKQDHYIFMDCSTESPIGRRSYCYDQEALDKRKENKPKNNALRVAAEMGIELLNETQYRQLQQLGAFDTNTSSWLLTPPNIRKLGGAIFGDFRYQTIFIYHNGASSYYAARGFRGALRV